jgi:hypothetical protein
MWQEGGRGMGADVGWGGAVGRQRPDRGGSGWAACARAAGTEHGKSGDCQMGLRNSAGRQRLNPI